jgi:prepilin-type N-terminal cleavage/methylation domain-containing protein
MNEARANGFTLIELLVVVTIIVVLLALLTPALDRAIEAAERAVCGSQLDLFGTAVPQYAMDNKRSYHSAVAWRSSPTADPASSYPHPLMVRPFRQPLPGQWNVEGIMPYTGGVEQLDAVRRAVKNPWYCPSNSADKSVANNNVSATGELNGVFGDPYMDLDYSYFGRVDVWNRNHCTRPQDLAGSRQLGGSRVLMADTLFYYKPGDTWWLNHGANGSSVHDPGFGGQPLVGFRQLDSIYGINKLFADGSVSWKNRHEFDYDKLNERDLNEPWVSNLSGQGAPNGAEGAITFY